MSQIENVFSSSQYSLAPDQCPTFTLTQDPLAFSPLRLQESSLHLPFIQAPSPPAPQRRIRCESEAKTKSHAGSNGGDYSKEEYKALRAEKNRQFARESRERKRIYVRTLENQIVCLQAELAQCRTRLARYELIDAKRDMCGAEKSTAVLAAVEELQRTHADPSQFQKILMRKMDEQFDGYKKAVAQLFRILLEVAVPLPVRFYFWEAENDIDMLKPENMCKLLGYQPGAKELGQLTEHIKACHLSYDETRKKMRAKFTRVTQRVRKNVRQMLESQKAIQLDSFRMLNFIKRQIASKYTAEHAVEELRGVPKLRWQPELSDESIFKVSDQDFWQDTSDTAANLDDEFVVSECAARPGCVAVA